MSMTLAQHSIFSFLSDAVAGWKCSSGWLSGLQVWQISRPLAKIIIQRSLNVQAGLLFLVCKRLRNIQSSLCSFFYAFVVYVVTLRLAVRCSLFPPMQFSYKWFEVNLTSRKAILKFQVFSSIYPMLLLFMLILFILDYKLGNINTYIRVRSQFV